MNTIWKIPLEITDTQQIMLPKGYELLPVDMKTTITINQQELATILVEYFSAREQNVTSVTIITDTHSDDSQMNYQEPYLKEIQVNIDE